MMWTCISVVILIVDAAINAEMEHQTSRVQPTGPPLPMGQRGAVVADTLARSLSEANPNRHLRERRFGIVYTVI